MGVDQGSSSTKAALLNSQGEVVEKFEIKIGPVSHSASQSEFPAELIAEQDPLAIESSILEIVRNAKAVAARKISGLGLALQRSGVLAWTPQEFNILHPMITWADRRFSQAIEGLEQHSALIQERCGLPLTAHYAAPKISWLQQKFANARVGTLDSYLINRFGGAFASEHTMAARTMLYRLDRGEWDPKLCNIFSVDSKRLPIICNSQRIHGSIEDISWRSCIGDQQAVLIARQANEEDISLNLGTIASLSWCTGETPFRAKGLIASVLNSERQKREFLLEAVSNCCGALIDQILKIVSAQQLEEILAGEPANFTTVIYYPLKGDGSPNWNRNAESLSENTSTAGRDDLIRALIENLVFFVADNLKIIGALRTKELKSLVVSGGVSQSAGLIKKLAQLTKLELKVGQTRHLGAIGAALSAAKSIGLDLKPPREEFSLHAYPEDNLLAQRYARWRELRSNAIKAQMGTATKFCWEMLSAS